MYTFTEQEMGAYQTLILLHYNMTLSCNKRHISTNVYVLDMHSYIKYFDGNTNVNSLEIRKRSEYFRAQNPIGQNNVKSNWS